MNRSGAFVSAFARRGQGEAAGAKTDDINRVLARQAASILGGTAMGTIRLGFRGWMKWFTLAITLSFALSACGRSVPSRILPRFQTIEAEKFILKDGNGGVRASLGLADGGVSLDLYDNNGKGRARLALNADGFPSFVVRDANAKSAIVLSVFEGDEKTTALAFYDQSGKIALSLGVTGTGSRIALYDEAGRERAILNNVPILSLRGPHRESRVMTGIVDEQPIITLIDTSGKVLFMVPQSQSRQEKK